MAARAQVVSSDHSGGLGAWLQRSEAVNASRRMYLNYFPVERNVISWEHLSDWGKFALYFTCSETGGQRGARKE